MDVRRENGLIVSYFLSRFDERAYLALAHGNQRVTHTVLGTVFGVPPATVKNWRDEFDPVHENSRVGWYQRALRPSRQLVVDQFRELSFDALLELAKELCSQPNRPIGWVVPGLTLETTIDTDSDYQSNGAAAENARGFPPPSRAATGRKAEGLFANLHGKTGLPVSGVLIDRRDSGDGYDFEIRGSERSVFVEVKGLSGTTGTLSLTKNEWELAKRVRDQFYLVLVRLVHEQAPEFLIVCDPAAKLSPKARFTPVVQETWSVNSPALLDYSSWQLLDSVD